MAAAAVLQACALHAPGRPGDARPDRVAVATDAPQPQTEPVVSRAGAVLQQKRRLSVVRDHHIEAAVVVEIADRQTSRWVRFGKCRARVRGYVAQLAALVVE